MFGFDKGGRHGSRHEMRHAMKRHALKHGMRAMRGGRGGPFGDGDGGEAGFGPGGFGGGFGGRGGPRGGSGGRRRVFDATELRLVLLKLIADQPRHGYDLIKAVEELSGGAYAPSPGVVYPTLTMLVDMGQVAEQAAEGTKRSFAISEAGKALIDQETKTVDELFARLAALADQSGHHQRSPIRRAMMNLHTALNIRVGAEAGADLAHDVAAILDDAARRIERL